MGHGVVSEIPIHIHSGYDQAKRSFIGVLNFHQMSRTGTDVTLKINIDPLDITFFFSGNQSSKPSLWQAHAGLYFFGGWQ